MNREFSWKKTQIGKKIIKQCVLVCSLNSAIDPLNLLITSPGMFSQSAMLKSAFLMWYQSHHILDIQNIPAVEIASREERVTVFLCFLGKHFKTIRL